MNKEKHSGYAPPFTVSPRAISLVAEISAQIERRPWWTIRDVSTREYGVCQPAVVLRGDRIKYATGRLPDGWDERAYMGDVGTPTGLVARSGGDERAYMGDVSTPAGCIKNLQHCMIFLHFTPPR